MRVLSIWFPLFIIGIALYFLFKGGFSLIVGIVLVGAAVHSFQELWLSSTKNKSDKEEILVKGSDFAHRFLLGTIIFLMVVHFFITPIDTGVLLVVLFGINVFIEFITVIFLSYKI